MSPLPITMFVKLYDNLERAYIVSEGSVIAEATTIEILEMNRYVKSI